MTIQRAATKSRPTFRKSRASSPSRSVVVPLVLAAALFTLVSAVAALAFGAVGAPGSSELSASASAPKVSKATSGRARRARKRTSSATHTKRPSTTAKSSRTQATSTKSAKTTSSVAAVGKPTRKAASTPKTLPEKMRSTIAGSTQLIAITGARIGSRSGTMRIYNKKAGRWVQVFSAPANFGANGLGDGTKRTEGDLQTPTGIWHIGSFLFGQHGSAPSGTKMRYRAITSHSWWSCQRDSTYNTWVESASHVSGEHLANATVQYEYAFDSGYNSLPNKRVMGRGTAIFIHCFEPAGNSLGPNTHGCVALSRADMRRVFGLLDPARHPSCSVGTLAAGTSTSIYAY